MQDQTSPVLPARSGALTSRALTYAGALPFLACALLPYAGIRDIPLLGSVEQALVSYGLAIASFMAGTLWAARLREPAGNAPPWLLLSNAFVLAAWISALAAPAFVALAVQALVFLFLLWADSRLFAVGLIGRDYWVLRQRISAIVVLALLVALFTAWPE